MSTNADGSFKKLSPQGEIVTGKINPLQERLAALGARIAELDRKWGGTLAKEASSPAGGKERASGAGEKLEGKGLLTNPFGLKAPEGVGPPGDLGSGTQSPGAALTPPAGRPSLIIRPTPTLAEPEKHEVTWAQTVWAAMTGKRDPVYAGEKGQDRFPDETIRVEKLRARGKTETTGNPSARARFVYSQEGGTCGIASQGQIIATSKGYPADPVKMRKLEDVLYDRALAQKCFPQKSPFGGARGGGSTPTHCMSRLLEEEGILVKRYYGASDQELMRVLRKGKMVIISLNSFLLWNQGTEGIWHAVVATGAEFERPGGALLGVYINDTGFDPPTGGRFVNATQFWEAWHSNGSVIVEPL